MAIEGLDNLKNKQAYFIEIYSFSNGPYTNGESTIRFPAFLTDFTDSYKSEWTPQSVYGKMDPISTFKSTSRNISLAFDIPSESPEDARQNLEKIDFLIRGLYPIYSQGKLGTRTISSPPMFRIKFANLVSNITATEAGNALRTGLLCYIPSFDFKPKTDNGYFVTNDDTLLPKLITASLNLNIIHEHALGNQNIGGKISPRINVNTFPHKPSGTEISAPTSTTSTTDASVTQAAKQSESTEKDAATSTVTGG